jgi:hypothetical protein
MLRNINHLRLCNGTRLTKKKKKVMKNVIEATIIKGKYKGEDVLISHIQIIPTDLLLDFKRLQFPVRMAFAMTINKSQDQSLQVCGIHLEFSGFKHGQLYVTYSRVGIVYLCTAKQNKKYNLSESFKLYYNYVCLSISKWNFINSQYFSKTLF